MPRKPAKRPRKIWTLQPPLHSPLPVPATIKEVVDIGAACLVESFLKPAYVKNPPPDWDFNYIVDIYARWTRNYFYFGARYCLPGPNALAPFFDSNFARMEYVGDNLFTIACLRRNNRWDPVGGAMPLDECLEAVKTYPAFQL